MRNIFRTTVIVSFVAYTLWFFMPEFGYLTNDIDVVSALSWSGYGGYFMDIVSLPYIIYTSYALISLGLVLFKIWARPAFLAITTISIFMNLINGYTVSTPIDNLLLNIVLLLDGAILTMLYLTSASNEFSGNA